MAEQAPKAPWWVPLFWPLSHVKKALKLQRPAALEPLEVRAVGGSGPCAAMPLSRGGRRGGWINNET